MTIDQAIERLTRTGDNFSNLAKNSNDNSEKLVLDSLSSEFFEVANDLQDLNSSTKVTIPIDVKFVGSNFKIDSDEYLTTDSIQVFRNFSSSTQSLNILIKFTNAFVAT